MLHGEKHRVHDDAVLHDRNLEGLSRKAVNGRALSVIIFLCPVVLLSIVKPSNLIYLQAWNP